MLSEMASKGVDESEEMIQKALRCSDLDEDVLKFINDHRQFDASAFYEKIRKSYNDKKSSLYKNIVVSDEVDCTDTVLTTLASLSLQILLYMKDVSNPQVFIRSVRFEEITSALSNYGKTFDLLPCMKVLQMIKADIKVFEYINNL